MVRYETTMISFVQTSFASPCFAACFAACFAGIQTIRWSIYWHSHLLGESKSHLGLELGWLNAELRNHKKHKKPSRPSFALSISQPKPVWKLFGHLAKPQLVLPSFPKPTVAVLNCSPQAINKVCQASGAFFGTDAWRGKVDHGESWKHVNIAMENGPFIVDLPSKNGDFPVRYVSLPEGKHIL